MLRQRIITALVLVALILATLAASATWPFALFALVLIAGAGWEWGRLNQSGAAGAVAMGALLAVAGALSLAAGWHRTAPAPLWWGVTALWLVFGSLALHKGPSSWPQLPRAARWALGVLALWAAWLALTQARGIGINFMLSMLCLVWAADIAAYFGGRRFGRRKLAPSISPGKSWEGVWSGMAGVLVLAVFWSWLDTRFAFDSPSLYTALHASFGIVGAAPALLLLAGFSVGGDLFESLVKRAAGAKDSSQLLPGHGGVLDRVDALLPVMPAALALVTMAAR